MFRTVPEGDKLLKRKTGILVSGCVTSQLRKLGKWKPSMFLKAMTPKPKPKLAIVG